MVSRNTHQTFYSQTTGPILWKEVRGKTTKHSLNQGEDRQFITPALNPFRSDVWPSTAKDRSPLRRC